MSSVFYNMFRGKFYKILDKTVWLFRYSKGLAVYIEVGDPT